MEQYFGDDEEPTEEQRSIRVRVTNHVGAIPRELAERWLAESLRVGLDESDAVVRKLRRALTG